MNSGFNQFPAHKTLTQICETVIEKFKEEKIALTFLNFSCVELKGFEDFILGRILVIDRFRFGAMCRQIVNNGPPVGFYDSPHFWDE